MEQTNYLYQDDKLNKYLGIAVAVHLGVFLIAYIFQVALGIDWFQSSNTKKEIEIIQSSVRVDVVAMPKFTVQELKKMDIAPPSQETKAEEVKPSVDNSKSDLEFKQKSKKVNLGNLLSNLSRKKTAKGKKKKVKGNKNLNAHRNQLRKLVLEGNKVSAGTSLVGDGLAQERTAFNNYVSALPNFVRPHWKLPSYLIDRGLKCRIRVFIASNGKILRAKIYESSGEKEFDQKALASVKSVNSFPKPDKGILPRVAAGDVILGFPL